MYVNLKRYRNVVAIYESRGHCFIVNLCNSYRNTMGIKGALVEVNVSKL